MEGLSKMVMDGVEIKMLFTLPALQYISGQEEKRKEFITEMHRQVSHIRDVLYAGYRCYCDAYDEEPTLKTEDFYSFVSRFIHKKPEGDGITAAIKEYNIAIRTATGIPLDEQPDEEEKKSLSNGEESKESAYATESTGDFLPGENTN